MIRILVQLFCHFLVAQWMFMDILNFSVIVVVIWHHWEQYL